MAAFRLCSRTLQTDVRVVSCSPRFPQGRSLHFWEPWCGALHDRCNLAAVRNLHSVVATSYDEPSRMFVVAPIIY
jgi:hypothetical protein